MGFFSLHTVGVGMNVFVVFFIPIPPVLLVVSHLDSFSAMRW
jgi:hypothetical protein